MNDIHITTSPVVHIRKFDGFFGPLWGIILYVVESRRVVKEYAAHANAVKAEANADAAEFERTAKIAEQKSSEIRKNCAANVHFVEGWKTGKGWQIKNRFTGDLMSEWHDMHGKCKYCNTPVTKRAYTFVGEK